MSVTIAILCGGQSRRMGEDKGLKLFLGRPLIERVVARVRRLSSAITLITNRPNDYAFLGLHMFGDETPGLGPLGGMLTALTHCQSSRLALIACDMPFVNPSLLAHAAKLLEDDLFDAAVPLTPNGYEPLHAVYRTSACLPAVQAAIDARELSLHKLLASLNMRAITPDECAPFDPHQLAFTNVNTPDEWLMAEQIAWKTEA
jgi:molybdopterin-guanine dinucleotide biosynthesis protein A